MLSVQEKLSRKIYLAKYESVCKRSIFFVNQGTQHGREKNDSNYYTTNSRIPHLPFISGFSGTHGTYRFLTIIEQVALLIGEGTLTLTIR